MAIEFTKHTKRGDKVYALPEPLTPLADTHAHLTCFWSKNPSDVLVRAGQAGVRRLITLYDVIDDEYTPQAYREQLDTWIREASNGNAVQVAGKQDACTASDVAGCVSNSPDTDASSATNNCIPTVSYLAGAHPYGAPQYTDEVHARLLAALDDPRCVGVGEFGLDYHYDADDDIEAAPHAMQIACMERQLAVALDRNLPVELHLRNEAGDEARAAHADAYAVLNNMGIPTAGCVLHCFTEDRATMERFVELGCYIAFGGAATFKRNEGIREAFAACPLDRMLFETDCPYMAPEPVRGLECEPAMVAFTANALARDRAARTGEDPAIIVRATWENARRLFG